VMLLCGEENLREVVLFPMNQRAEDLLMGAPSEVATKQLRELHIRLNLPGKNEHRQTSIKTVEIPSNFVGDFEVRDNLVFNADLLCKLTEANESDVYNKLIVIQLGSIVEAALAQLIYRAQNYNREGVPNISEADRSEIEGKKIDKFDSVINVLKKYNVLDGLGGDIYEDLHKLRKYRNKVHIQDNIKIDGVSHYENAVFSDDICTWAFRLTVRVLQYLSEHLRRPEHLDAYTKLIIIPSK